MIFTKPIELVTEDDLMRLIHDRVAEQQTIDYKGAFVDNDRGKDDFRIDVTSFANAQGGYIIYGMKEENGFPTELCGMDIQNPDNFKIRLDDLVQTKIHPRIPGVRIHALQLSNGKYAVIVRVPKSFAKPHQVQINKDDFQFHSRNSSGKYRLNVDELRSLFLMSDTLTERIRNFRRERLGNIIAGDIPVRLNQSPIIVLHLVPLDAFSEPRTFSLEGIENRSDVAPLEGSISNSRYNLDGFLTYAGVHDSGEVFDYLQVFRNGIFEAVDAFMMSPQDGKKIIPSQAYEELIWRNLTRLLKAQQDMGAQTPVLVMLSILGVEGYAMATSHYQFAGRVNRIERNDLLLPEVLLEDINTPAQRIMRPIFDAVWNACGFARSMNYNEAGDWTGQR